MKIPKIKKLPSGAWNCRVRVGGVEYSITDYDKDKVYAQAVAYKAGIIKAKRQPERITVKGALEQYIDERDQILSPGTVNEYNNKVKAFAPLFARNVDTIRARDIQRWVNDYARNHSPKTVKSVYSLLRCALVAAGADPRDVTARLPEVRQPKRHTPTKREITRLVAAVRGTEMELPVYLAAFGSLRRSEICALTRDDVTDTGVWVTKALVQDKNGQWVLKQTKARSSDRHALLPPEVVARLKEIPPGERITQLSPNAVTHRFDHIVKRIGAPHFRFHDLRAYWATVAHSLGMPDYYIMRNGGWSSMATPGKHYLRDVEEFAAPSQNAAQTYFENVLNGDEIGDENENPA